MQRLAWVTVAFVLVSGCESGTSQGPAAIGFTPGPPPTGQGFVALYAPPVDVGPYPNNIYSCCERCFQHSVSNKAVIRRPTAES